MKMRKINNFVNGNHYIEIYIDQIDVKCNFEPK